MFLKSYYAYFRRGIICDYRQQFRNYLSKVGKSFYNLCYVKLISIPIGGSQGNTQSERKSTHFMMIAIKIVYVG
jgi:hypothetical protein